MSHLNAHNFDAHTDDKQISRANIFSPNKENASSYLTGGIQHH